jgi:hypothetical protein
MQNILLWILSIPFLYINFKIISSDLKYKKIPNKYLLYMLFILPFYYLYTFLYFDINYLFFPIQIILTIIISFVLYYYWIWSAWDAKYLLVLALFLPQIWIITFVWNIALITIVYLFLYFIWFYFWKCLFDFNYTKSLYTQIYNDLWDKLSIFFKHNNWNYSKKIIFFRILKLILLFLILFVSIRLARLYLFADIMDSTYFKELMKLAKSYSIYFIILLWLLFLWIIYFFKFLINNLKKYLLKRIEFRNESTLDIYLILIMLYVLICFVIYEYSINPNEIKTYLFKILTLSIWLWILYKILFYSYEVTFQIAESYFINIKDLNEW